jgi:hypothetical protein
MSAKVDGELTVVRTRRAQHDTAGSARSGKEQRVAGGLPFPSQVRTAVEAEAKELGYDAGHVEAWLQPMVARIDAGTEPWPDDFSDLVHRVRAEHERGESPDEWANRVLTSLEGALTIDRDTEFLAVLRIPRTGDTTTGPLLSLMDVTWLMDVLDEQRRTLVAQCRTQGRSWADIAQALGVTRASAWQRYSDPND